MIYMLAGDISGLMTDSSLYDKYFGELSSYRKNKALEIKSHTDKCRSVGVGAVLDRCLMRLGLREKDMSYEIKKTGKPFFQNFPDIHFNLSHSKSRVFCVISDNEIGCDVECIREARRAEKIAERFFSEAEKKYLEKSGDPQEYTFRFFQVWTLKESYVKYTGQGLQCPFESFSGLDISLKVNEISGCRFLVSGEGLGEGIVSDDRDYIYSACISREHDDKDLETGSFFLDTIIL